MFADQQQRDVFALATFGPHPQPVLPAAFASASWTQHASAPAGAGPPQQSLAVSSAFAVFVVSLFDARCVFVMPRETRVGVKGRTISRLAELGSVACDLVCSARGATRCNGPAGTDCSTAAHIRIGAMLSGRDITAERERADEAS